MRKKIENCKKCLFVKKCWRKQNFQNFFLESLPVINLHLWWKFEVKSLILLKVIQVLNSMTSSNYYENWLKIEVFPKFFEFLAIWTLWPCPIVFLISIRFSFFEKSEKMCIGFSRKKKLTPPVEDINLYVQCFELCNFTG